jgi:hypothetical protein
MQIDKQQILDLIKDRGGDYQAAQQELPDKVDPQQHGDLLSRFGVDPSDIMSRLGGGSGFSL